MINEYRNQKKILEQIFTGQMPVKRNNPKPGQSPFYYVAFQSDDNDEEPIGRGWGGQQRFGRKFGRPENFSAGGRRERISSRRPIIDRANAGRRRAVVAEPYFCRKQGRMNGKRNVKLPMRR